MNEKDIMIIQKMMAERGLSAEAERRLAKLVEEERRKRTEERREQPVVMTEESRPGITYIDCPYSADEKEKIMEWIRKHGGHDAKALAVALWLAGGISSQEIANLRRSDYRGGKTAGETLEFDRRIFQKWNRAEIVRRALKLHPEDQEFVFMIPKGANWKKLQGCGVQMKMYNICDDIGITYKSFRNNEAIMCDE